MKTLWRSIVLAGLLAAGCGDDMPTGSVQPTIHGHYTCTAQVQQVMLIYRIAGNYLTLTNSLLGQSQNLTRVSAGASGRPVYGTWLMLTDTSDQSELHLKLVLKVKIDPDQVTAIGECSSTIGNTVAMASSPAVIDDTTINILESHMDTKEVSQ